MEEEIGDDPNRNRRGRWKFRFEMDNWQRASPGYKLWRKYLEPLSARVRSACTSSINTHAHLMRLRHLRFPRLSIQKIVCRSILLILLVKELRLVVFALGFGISIEGKKKKRKKTRFASFLSMTYSYIVDKCSWQDAEKRYNPIKLNVLFSQRENSRWFGLVYRFKTSFDSCRTVNFFPSFAIPELNMQFSSY